jgi:hypothetical protein
MRNDIGFLISALLGVLCAFAVKRLSLLQTRLDEQPTKRRMYAG